MDTNEPVIRAQVYNDAFIRWAKAIMRANSVGGHRPVPGQNTSARQHGSAYAEYIPVILSDFILDYQDVEKPAEAKISVYCEMLRGWMDVKLQEAKEAGKQDALDALGGIMMDVGKSALLGRMIYGGEELRVTPCPQHAGMWSGLSARYDGGCSEGCDLTGWLPNNMSHGQIEEMIEKCRQSAIDREKSFIAQHPDSPFTAAAHPKRAWQEHKAKRAQELNVNPAVFGLQRRNRPTPREMNTETWWYEFNLDALALYLESTGWEALNIEDKPITSWWKYTGEPATQNDSASAHSLPDALVDTDFRVLIQVPTPEAKKNRDFARGLQEAIEDIARITDTWPIDVIAQSQEIGTRPSDLETEEFLQRLTPQMFTAYLSTRQWKLLGDDGNENTVWQHRRRPRILRDNRSMPPMMRYSTIAMTPKTLNYDRLRAVKVNSHTDYADYAQRVYDLLVDLERHEDRWRGDIANDVLALARKTPDKQIPLLNVHL